MNNRGPKSSNAIVSELIEVLKKVKRGAEIDTSVNKVDADVHKIDTRVDEMNKRGAKKVIRRVRNIKSDLGDIKRRPEVQRRST